MLTLESSNGNGALAPTYVDKFRIVSLSKVVQDCGIVKVRQISHVFDFLEFRRIHLWDELLF